MGNLLVDIYQQARADNYSINLDDAHCTSSISYGFKIVKAIESEEIVIFNMTLGGDHYQVIDSHEHDVFLKKGWKLGCYTLYLRNCLRKLKELERKIADAIADKTKLKFLKVLKEERKRILHNYNKIKIKLNDNKKISI